MSTNISVTKCKRGDAWCTNVQLVRGVGTKTVRVTIYPPWDRLAYVDETKIAIDAAKLATKKGWRKIIVATDSHESNTIRGFNWHQYQNERYPNPNECIGEFLGFIDK